MFIVGVGAAYPGEEIADPVLKSLPGNLTPEDTAHLQRYGVASRRSSLPARWVASSGAGDVLRSRTVATDSPTTLGAKAVRQALDRAHIAIEQVGLIIADTATPYQTCPSEAQRIGGEFGVKVPAYDVTAGASALPFFLSLLTSWKKERIPEYVVCVSTNTPTQQLSYATQSVAAYTFGDAACAVVLSPTKPGKLRVESARSCRSGSAPCTTVIERELTFVPGNAPATAEVFEKVRSALSPSRTVTGNHYLVGPQLFGAELRSRAEELGIANDRIITSATHTGYALGSSAGVALDSIWDRVQPGDRITLVEGADGVWSSAILDVLS